MLRFIVKWFLSLLSIVFFIGAGASIKEREDDTALVEFVLGLVSLILSEVM